MNYEKLNPNFSEWAKEIIDNNLHFCSIITNHAGYGEAIADCYEKINGELWVSNGEYSSQVNYCPYCGHKAKVI
jgi:wobble nucleotide-excising tRNase